MKNVAFLIVLFSISYSVFSQPTVFLKVVDVVSHKPVEYPIILTDLNNADYGDINGVINVNFNNFKEYVTISCIGYLSETVNLSGLKKDSVFYLEPAVYELPPVIVTARKKPLIIHSETKGKQNATFSTAIKTVYVSEMIKHSSGICYIKSITFKFNTRKKIGQLDLLEDVYLRLHVFDKDEMKGIPGKPLLNENYVFKVQKDFAGFLKLNSFIKPIRIDQSNYYIGFEYIGLINLVNRELSPFNIQCLSDMTGKLYYKAIGQENWYSKTGINLYVKVEYEVL